MAVATAAAAGVEVGASVLGTVTVVGEANGSVVDVSLDDADEVPPPEDTPSEDTTDDVGVVTATPPRWFFPPWPFDVGLPEIAEHPASASAATATRIATVRLERTVSTVPAKPRAPPVTSFSVGSGAGSHVSRARRC